MNTSKEDRLATAKEFISSGRFESAVDLLESMLRAEPRNIEVLLLKAQAEIKQSFWPEAQSSALNALRIDQNSALGNWLCGKADLGMGAADRAHAYLKAAEANGIQDPELLLDLGSCCYQIGACRDSLRYCQRYLAAGGQNQQRANHYLSASKERLDSMANLKISKSMKANIDQLIMALQVGDSTQTAIPCSKPNLIWHHAGELLVKTEQIIVCDPLCVEDDFHSLTLSSKFPNGSHSFWKLINKKTKETQATAIIFEPIIPKTWKPALDLTEAVHTISVESGLVGVCDSSIFEYLSSLDENEREKLADESNAGKPVHTATGANILFADTGGDFSFVSFVGHGTKAPIAWCLELSSES